MEEGYCKLFIDTDMARNDLCQWLAQTLEGQVDWYRIVTSTLELDVMKNIAFDPVDRHKEDGFLYFRYFLDIFPLPDVPMPVYIQTVGQLLISLWDHQMPAVAACDFEDELPRGKWW